MFELYCHKYYRIFEMENLQGTERFILNGEVFISGDHELNYNLSSNESSDDDDADDELNYHMQCK